MVIAPALVHHNLERTIFEEFLDLLIIHQTAFEAFASVDCHDDWVELHSFEGFLSGKSGLVVKNRETIIAVDILSEATYTSVNHFIQGESFEHT